MIDVARVAGVSVTTVSRVVNGVDTVDLELREKVVAAIAETGYQRNANAHTLRARGHSATIGLLIEDIANSFYSVMAAGVAEVALERGVLLFTASSEEDPERERSVLAAMCERRVDGLLIVPTKADHSYLRSQIELGTHVVCLDRRAAGLKADAVLIDNAGGTRQAIEHLLSRGHRRIALLFDSPDIPTMRIRMDTALKVLAEAGRPADPRLVREPIHTPAEARAAMLELLAEPKPPTAVFCGNNRSTIGAVEALIAADATLDVVGFDDFEAASSLARPVTIVGFDTREMGRRGARMLFNRIDGNTARTRRHVMPTYLVPRGMGQ